MIKEFAKIAFGGVMGAASVNVFKQQQLKKEKEIQEKQQNFIEALFTQDKELVVEAISDVEKILPSSTFKQMKKLAFIHFQNQEELNKLSEAFEKDLNKNIFSWKKDKEDVSDTTKKTLMSSLKEGEALCGGTLKRTINGELQKKLEHEKSILNNQFKNTLIVSSRIAFSTTNTCKAGCAPATELFSIKP